MAEAMFGAGCFWGVEAAFKKVDGVTATEVGYAGGQKDNPTYKDVCNGNSGHTEVVKVDYDPKVVSYEELLEVFWSNHNPTQLNRQGPDFGFQYRSVIFTYDDEQKRQAEKSRAELDASGRFNKPIATKIEPVTSYFPAEDYHQDYYTKQGISHCPI